MSSLSRSRSISFLGSGHLAIGRAISQTILLVAAVVVPNILGASAYGQIASILAFVAILEVASSGGLQVVEIRHVAPSMLSGDLTLAGAWAATVWWGRLLLAVLASGVAVIVFSMPQWSDVSVALAFTLGLYTLGRSVTESSRHLLLTVGRTRSVAVVEVGRALVILASAALFYELGGLVGVLVAATVLQVVLSALTVRAQNRALRTPARDFSGRLLRQGFPLAAAAWIGVLAWTAQSQAAVVVVGAAGDFTEAAILGIGVQAFTAVQTMVISVRSAGLPEVSHRFDIGDNEAVAEWIGRFSFLSVSLLTGLAITWALVGGEFVRFLPVEMAPAKDVIALMLVATVPASIALVIDGVLFSVGRAKYATAGRILFGLATVVPLGLTLASSDLTLVSYVYVVAACVFAFASIIFLIRTGLRIDSPLAALFGLVIALAIPAAIRLSDPTSLLVGMLALHIGGSVLFALAMRKRSPQG